MLSLAAVIHYDGQIFWGKCRFYITIFPRGIIFYDDDKDDDDVVVVDLYVNVSARTLRNVFEQIICPHLRTLVTGLFAKKRL